MLLPYLTQISSFYDKKQRCPRFALVLLCLASSHPLLQHVAECWAHLATEPEAITTALQLAAHAEDEAICESLLFVVVSAVFLCCG